MGLYPQIGHCDIFCVNCFGCRKMVLCTISFCWGAKEPVGRLSLPTKPGRPAAAGDVLRGIPPAPKRVELAKKNETERNKLHENRTKQSGRKSQPTVGSRSAAARSGSI